MNCSNGCFWFGCLLVDNSNFRVDIFAVYLRSFGALGISIGALQVGRFVDSIDLFEKLIYFPVSLLNIVLLFQDSFLAL
jgi:hypothetical protein